MRTLNYKTWTIVSCLLLVGAISALLWFDEDVRILSALAIPPLIAALTTTPRRTAALSAISVAVILVTGLRDGDLMSTGFAARGIIISIVAGLAVQVAILRERDMRTRRRLALINSARSELDAAAGLEDNLASLTRATVVDFAEWTFLDIRMPDGETHRSFQCAHARNKHEGPQPRTTTTAASAAFEANARRDGPMLIQSIDPSLLEALFERNYEPLRKSCVLVVPVEIDDVRACYFILCPTPHPPWGEAEVTQLGSLARSAALAARTDQLIDRLSFTQQELRGSRDQISAIVHGIADGVTAQNIAGEMIFANEKAAEMFGFESAEELVGTHFGDVHPRMDLRTEAGDPFDPMKLPSKRAFAGEEEPSALVRYTIKATGRELWTLVKSTAVRDESGLPTLAITVIEDVTEHRQEEIAQTFLSAASKELSESLDLESATLTIAQAPVPRIGDWCVVDLVDSAGEIETVAVAHVDDTLAADLRETLWLKSDSARRAVVDEVLKTGKLETRTGDSPHWDSQDGAAASKALADVKATVVAPISVRGKPLGVLTLARTRVGSEFSDFDLETILEFGRRAGITIDNSRMHTERLRTLASLQQSLIPSELPTIDGVSLSAAFRPSEAEAEVGGDFYDAFKLPDGNLAMVVGDVCGKGPTAASVTALARYTIRTAAMSESDPAAIIATLNKALLEQIGDDRFCTIAFTKLIDIGTAEQRVEVISSGHPSPLLLTADGPRAIGSVGTLLGVVESPEIDVKSVALPSDSALVLYTDGLSAGQSSDDAAYALQLLRDFRPNGDIDIAKAVDEAARSVQSSPNRDDVAIMVALV